MNIKDRHRQGSMKTEEQKWIYSQQGTKVTTLKCFIFKTNKTKQKRERKKEIRDHNGKEEQATCIEIHNSFCIPSL